VLFVFSSTCCILKEEATRASNGDNWHMGTISFHMNIWLHNINPRDWPRSTFKTELIPYASGRAVATSVSLFITTPQ
jgi:hypothetical protein